MKKARFKNYGLWISVVSAVLLIVQQVGHLTGLFDLTDDMSKEWLAAADSFLGLLVILGVLSNPTKPDGGGYNL